LGYNGAFLTGGAGMTLKNLFDMGINPTGELARIVEICRTTGPFCLIGGLAFNCHVEPVFTADADFAIRANDTEKFRSAFKDAGLKVRRNRYDLETSFPGSALKVHLTFDPRYSDFPSRSVPLRLFDEIEVPVASVADLIRGKMWASADPDRKASKRMKDKMDLMRMYEELPETRDLIPEGVFDSIETNPRSFER